MKRASKAVYERQNKRLTEIREKSNSNPKGILSASEIHMVLHCTGDKNELLELLEQIEVEYPIDVVIKRANKSRTLAQNRTQWQWFKDASEQGDQTANEYRGYCKLHFGIPVLRRDSPDYREKYDRIIRPMTYEKKLELMVEPFDFPVTSAMNIAQHSEFLDSVRLHFEGKGFELTPKQKWDY